MTGIDIKMPWQSVIDTVGGIISKVVPDRAAAQAATAQLQQMATAGQLQEELLQLQAVTSSQTDINKAEAASPSVFVAGPRPAVMWVCVAALAYQYLLRPLWTGIALIAAHPIPAPGLPGLDDNLYQLLWALLGLGAMRSYDKVKGVDTKTVSLKGK
jgi:hypothetical protein